MGWTRRWKEGFRYSKAGVVTVDFVSLSASQRALLGGFDREKGAALMEALDAANGGSGGVRRTGQSRGRCQAPLVHQVRTAHAALYDTGCGTADGPGRRHRLGETADLRAHCAEGRPEHLLFNVEG